LKTMNMTGIYTDWWVDCRYEKENILTITN